MIETIILFLVISILFNVALFLIAFKLQSDKLTDISYALTFLIIGITAYALNEKSLYNTVILLMIVAWAIRIGSFLLQRVLKSGKDSRFDLLRSNFFKFGQFWLLQGVTVWVLMLPVVLAIYGKPDEFGLIAFIGLTIFIAGLLIETIADLQKSKFRNDVSNKDKWIDSGLWRYSRHPNYFGEILVWIGFYVFALQSLDLNSALIALASPIFISLLLIFVSGIPLLEKSADKKWGNNKKYLDYKRKTSILLLFPNRK